LHITIAARWILSPIELLELRHDESVQGAAFFTEDLSGGTQRLPIVGDYTYSG